MGERDHHYETNWEFGIAVGSSQGSNRATLVYMPGKGTRAWERLDVRALKMQQRGAATALQKQDLAPVIGENCRSIKFQSSAPTINLSMQRGDDERIGTQANDVAYARTHHTYSLQLYLHRVPVLLLRLHYILPTDDPSALYLLKPTASPTVESTIIPAVPTY
jgi:hypothetical protein